METARTLGCTGGIGSGKSYVSNIFAQLGYPVYYSDDRAKLLYDTVEAVIIENGVIIYFVAYEIRDGSNYILVGAHIHI